MKLLKSVAALRCYLELNRPHAPRGIGLVPTMGALHGGHRSLMDRARSQNDLVIVSIFVNPLQFAADEDFGRYPRDWEGDVAACEAAGVDALFVPTAAALGLGDDRAGGDQFVVVPPETLTETLCGRSRPGHFTGVATIVAKLLNLVQPDRAYFGQKDAQQLALIRQMVASLDWPVEVVACPIVREIDGLALSSRNRYLTGDDRQRATVLFRSLAAAVAKFRGGCRDRDPLLATARTVLEREPAAVVDYLDLVDPNTLKPLDRVAGDGLLAIAATVGTARLIDNVLLRDRGLVVAIDGPAGAGKSTVTRRVAAELGLLFLDTGAMYRALTWRVIELGIDPGDRLAVAEVVADCEIRFGAVVPETGERQIWIDDRDATQAIRSAAVTAQVSAIAAHPEVRTALVAQQRRMGDRGGLVAEGRDIGTCVFPDADVKIFLTATVEERSQRRAADLRDRGEPVPDLTELAASIAERDRLDSTRPVSPLQKAADAWELITDGLTIEEVVAAIVERCRAQIS